MFNRKQTCDWLWFPLNLYLSPHKQFENIVGLAILNILGCKNAKWGSPLKIDMAACIYIITTNQHSILNGDKLKGEKVSVFYKAWLGDFPGSPVVRTVLPIQRAQVWSPLGELRSHRLRGKVKK